MGVFGQPLQAAYNWGQIGMHGARRADQWMQAGKIRRAMRAGSMEALGFEYGAKGQTVGRFFGESRTAWSAARGAGKGLLRSAGSAAWGAMPLLGTALLAYQGYKEGGILGAAGGMVESMVWGAAFRGIGAAFAPIAGTAAVALGSAAVVGGTIAYRRNAVSYNKRLRRSEFASGNITDPFGTMATIRRRSIQALHNSNMGGRISLGREAQLMGAAGPFYY